MASRSRSKSMVKDGNDMMVVPEGMTPTPLYMRWRQLLMKLLRQCCDGCIAWFKLLKAIIVFYPLSMVAYVVGIGCKSVKFGCLMSASLMKVILMVPVTATMIE